MEQKTYSIIKNFLFPVKTKVVLDEDFIQMGKKKMNWKDVKSCSCHIMSVNKATNYIVTMEDVNRKKLQINIVHSLTAKKEKKEIFADIYDTTVEQLQKYHVQPRAQEALNNIQKGNEVTLAKAVISNKGVEILKGMVKKEKVFIPMEDAEIQFIDGSGGFNISSIENPKNRQFIQMSNPDARCILAVLGQLVTPPKEAVGDAAPDAP